MRTDIPWFLTSFWKQRTVNHYGQVHNRGNKPWFDQCSCDTCANNDALVLEYRLYKLSIGDQPFRQDCHVR